MATTCGLCVSTGFSSAVSERRSGACPLVSKRQRGNVLTVRTSALRLQQCCEGVPCFHTCRPQAEGRRSSWPLALACCSQGAGDHCNAHAFWPQQGSGTASQPLAFACPSEAAEGCYIEWAQLCPRVRWIITAWHLPVPLSLERASTVPWLSSRLLQNQEMSFLHVQWRHFSN